MNHIYTPRTRTDDATDPMRAFVLFSDGASSMGAMLDDPNHKKLYEVVGAAADNFTAKGIDLYKKRVNISPFNRRKYYCDNGFKPGDLPGRQAFCSMLMRQLEPFKPDIVCLSGYMQILSDEFVDAYANRILNVHPADLSILANEVQRIDASGLSTAEAENLIKHSNFKRKLRGRNTVRDAIIYGETETRSTVHILDKDVDTGPIVTQSKAFEIDPMLLEKDGLDKYAKDLQGRMKIEGDGPAYLKALELIAQGRIAADGSELFLDGKPLPYGGYRLA